MPRAAWRVCVVFCAFEGLVVVVSLSPGRLSSWVLLHTDAGMSQCIKVTPYYCMQSLLSAIRLGVDLGLAAERDAMYVSSRPHSVHAHHSFYSRKLGNALGRTTLTEVGTGPGLSGLCGSRLIAGTVIFDVPLDPPAGAFARFGGSELHLFMGPPKVFFQVALLVHV